KQSTGIQSTSTQGQTASPAPSPNATTVSDAQTAKKLREPDVIYVPTPPEVVDAMLKVANVRRGDVHYDLGSGDGRIVITAAQKFSTRGTGIDINPERIKEANANAQKAGVSDRVRFLNEDLFEANISDATVVTLYLLNSLNLRLLPKLLKDLKPGTRIVSHAFDMGSWKPEQTLNIDGRSVFFWTIPEKGTPAYDAALAAASGNSGTQN
ncbi:MAG: methyltransferase domain-containing protein, partial [Pyrinomonadaceae bacterium]|nr:methyltransferase domain-containing protein [Pyrinomonadaceae bacterium]